VTDGQLSVDATAVPLITVTFATLPNDLRTEGTGVYSPMRNLGSAIGIPVTDSLPVSNTQMNHAILATFVSPFNYALQQPGAAQFWNPYVARSIVALNSEVSRQATVIAYIDEVTLMLILAVAALPLVWLIRSKPQATLAVHR
jgi:DHA2 family multidrug resistance protein